MAAVTWPPEGWASDGDGAKGPCPLCRSTDGRRAWARRYSGRWAAGCPSCSAATHELLPSLGIVQAQAKRDPLEHIVRRSTPRAPGRHDTPAAVLWSVAAERPVDGSQGIQIYFTDRIGPWPNGWPWPASIGIIPWGRLRPDVEAVLGAHVNAPGSRPIPIPWHLWQSSGRGAIIVYRFHNPTESTEAGAVQAEFVMQSGGGVVRVELAGAKRYTVGETRGRAFVVDPPADPPTETWICEGPTTACAIAADHPDARVIACGGELQHAVPHVRTWIPRVGDIRLAGEVGAPVVETWSTLRALYGADRVPPPWRAPVGSVKGSDYADVRRSKWR